MASIPNISTSDKNKLDKAISPYVYTIGKSNTSSTELTVRAPKNSRTQAKKELESLLKKARIDFSIDRSGGSTGSTIIEYEKHKIRIIYKPISGGMSETTLNSTITELAPALAFMASKKSFPSADAFYQFICKADSNGVYVAKDEVAGKSFIESMPSSSKFKEKMQNAQAILNYLWDEHKKAPIKQVYWGYRAKPEGIKSTHKGDLFIKYETGNILGVSLKAGGAKTAEPQLNTYVNKFFDDLGYASDKKMLMSIIYRDVHSKLSLPENWYDRAQKKQSIDVIELVKKQESFLYNQLYAKMLELVRDAVIKASSKSMKDTVKYVEKHIINKDIDVPLVIVKANRKKYTFITDEEVIELFLPKVTSVTSYASKSSTQDWFIELRSKGDKMVLKMSLRSNKVPPMNKIAQGFNLALKFNGIK